MFGVKFRSWMETHIVRPRKKQQQQQQQQQPKGKGKGKVVPERPLLDSAGNSPTSPLVTKKDDHHVLHCGKIAYTDDIQCPGNPGGDKQAETMAALSAQHHHHHRHHHHAYHHHGVIANTTGNNLSSPESAYSTGYSTDGTSPGASFPPEYYINIRTGTHYFHPACAAASQHHVVIAPGAPRHGDQNHIRVPVSPACKVMSTSGQNTLHRRTESCDESRYPAVIRTSFASLDEPTSPPPSAGPGTGLSMLPTPVAAAAVATASSVTASPRQRNRIRTNPWLSSSNTSTTTASVKGRNGGATTDTGGESSSCSSCKLSMKTPPPISAAAPLQKGGESSSSYGSGSDVTLPRKQLNGNPACTTVTTESEENLKNSPRQQDWSRSPPSANKEQRGSVCSSSSTASSTSTSSSSCHTANNTSDFSDDDLTLNEMLGKFDESYVYEKETDILSDSDPTDCEEEYGDNSDLDTAGQDGGDEQDPQDEEELDFIDNGSYVELNPAELDDGTDKSTSSSGLINKGHCTYHIPNTDFVRKPTLRFRESFLRRASARRHAKDENSPTTTATGSPVPGSRRPSIRKFNAEEEGHQKLSRRSSRDGSTRHKPSRHPHDNATGQNTYSRSSSEKRKVRCSVRRSLKDRAGKEPTCLAQVSAQNLNRILMERVLYRGGNGCALVSRSAGNTPVSLRRRILPGEKPASPSRALPQRAEAEKPSCNDGGWLKQRSYSISCPRPSPGPYLTTFSSEAALIEADKEADKKYKELIQEAEHILVSMKEETVTNGIGDEKPCDNSAVEEARRNALARIEELKQQRNLRRMAQEEKTQGSLSSSSDSDGSITPRQTSDAVPPASNEEEKEKPTKDQQRPPLMTFRSIDLGHHDLDVSCPQSEPVKRKVYSCSATFDKLQRSLEKSQHQASLRLKPDVERKPLEKGGSLRDKLDALRRERMEVEAKVRAAQEEERQRQDDVAQSQRQLSLFRRKMLLHTIEGLKRSLEDQSAKLQETYQQEGVSQKQHDSPEQ